jgi:hypothetical protein
MIYGGSMTKERLQLLSYADLEKAALKVGLDVHSEKSKDDLIESILDALEEEKIEKSISNNLVMKIEEKKYEIQCDRDLDIAEITEDFETRRLNVTKSVFMLRDPEWGFCYWLLNKEDRRYIRKNASGAMFIRVYALKEDEFSHENIDDFFDIPVNDSDENWYINLPNSGMYYCIGVMYEENGEEKMLCRSNTIFTPSIDISFGAGAVPEEILSKYGIYDDVSSDSAPQRIINDSDFE